jgi:hypothetical protein
MEGFFDWFAGFGAFYEQKLFLTWMITFGFAGLILLFRLGRLFFRYIQTGGWDAFYKSCYGYHLMDGDGFDTQYMPLLFHGCHPGAILVDVLSLAAAAFFAGILWLPLSIILPFIGLAYLLRKKIAKKQDFISKLDGTHQTQGGGREA